MVLTFPTDYIDVVVCDFALDSAFEFFAPVAGTRFQQAKKNPGKAGV
jgi:hypothetical protein